MEYGQLCYLMQRGTLAAAEFVVAEKVSWFLGDSFKYEGGVSSRVRSLTVHDRDREVLNRLTEVAQKDGCTSSKKSEQKVPIHMKLTRHMQLMHCTGSKLSHDQPPCDLSDRPTSSPLVAECARE